MNSLLSSSSSSSSSSSTSSSSYYYSSSCVSSPTSTFQLFLLFSSLMLIFPTYSSNPFNPADNPSLYQSNSLLSAQDIFPFFDDGSTSKSTMPSPRVHHSITAVGSFIAVYGGYHSNGSLLGDLNLFHVESQRWSSPIQWLECCNTAQTVIDVVGLENKTSGSIKSYSFLRPGFQGDYPLPRAEHSAVALNAKMYLFGGITSDFGLMQDFYVFDSTQLLWQPLKFLNGGIPPRRAGHIMAGDTETGIIYIFGGRGKRFSVGISQYFGMNDLWSFDSNANAWNLLGSQTEPPLGRQYAAGAVCNHDVYIFGGIDPVNGEVFNDLWVYRVGLSQWQLLFSPTPISTGLFPPPLSGAHMIAVSGSSGANLLLYGGVGGGGACQGESCKPTETLLGQLYVFSMSLSSWSSPASTNGVSKLSLSDSVYITGTSWIYGRLSTSWPSSPELSDSGKMVKSFALEEVVYVPERGLLYEFGGASAVTDELSSAGQVGTTLYTTSNIAASRDPPQLDSSGSRAGPDVDWASYEEQQFMDQLQTPTNGFWTFAQGFVNQSSDGVPSQPPVVFLRAFRVYSVNPTDLVLVQERRRPNI